MHIVADIGGTKMRFAGSKDLADFTEPVIVETPHNYVDGLAAAIEAIRKVAGDEKITTAAMGVPGVLSQDKRSLLSIEHLPGWSSHPFARDVESIVGGTFFLENDTALVGLGEAVSGAGKGASIVAYITVSTGVNGVRIIDGKIDRAASGFEIGGQYLSTDEKLVSLEELISGSAVNEKYGMHPKELGKDWKGWEELARIAAIGIHNTILHWSPDRVVLGGSMFKEVGISVESVTEHLRVIMKKFSKIPEVVHSTLHDEGGLYGGIARLR